MLVLAAFCVWLLTVGFVVTVCVATRWREDAEREELRDVEPGVGTRATAD